MDLKQNMKVGIHQGSVLSPILFAIVLEALSRGFSAGLPWELLYAEDLVIMADSLDELSVKLERWMAELSAKGLKVNIKKTKIMISMVPVQSRRQGNTHAVSA